MVARNEVDEDEPTMVNQRWRDSGVRLACLLSVVLMWSGACDSGVTPHQEAGVSDAGADMITDGNDDAGGETDARDASEESISADATSDDSNEDLGGRTDDAAVEDQRDPADDILVGDASDAASDEGGCPFNCAPYTCDPQTNRCRDVCVTDGDCARGRCRMGSCNLDLMTLCSSNLECASGVCAQGICCNRACSGPCQRCDLPGNLGQCSPVPAGTPDDRCVAEPKATCGTTGQCDGKGGCSRYPAATMCTAASCSDGTATTAATCDGNGTCVPGVRNVCSFGCNKAASSCNRGCPSGDAICAGDAYCSGDEECQPRKAAGAPCGSDHECVSRACAQGACGSP